MCLSPKTSRTFLGYYFKSKNTDRTNSKEEKTKNKLSQNRLSSRNNEIMKNQKKNIYRKILPNNLIQFSSNNSTSSNNSIHNLNNVQTHNCIKEYESGYKNPDYLKKNIKFYNKHNLSNILMKNTKEKLNNMFQKYKNKVNNNRNYSSNYMTNRHNRSSSKNLNQDLVISKIVDKLVINNINKMKKFNFNISQIQLKSDIERTFLGSKTTKEFNHNLNSSKKNIYFPISTNKKIKSPNNKKNISSLGITRHSALTSSTGNIMSQKNVKPLISNKSNKQISNNNFKKNKSDIFNKKDKMMELSKSKEINNNITFNNYYIKQKKFSNGVGLNNNKIEYVQINLFNNGHDDKISKDGKNYMFNKIDKKIISNINSVKNIQKNREKEVKLFDNINGSSDGLNVTKSILNFNDKIKQIKEISTPEENHFLAVNYVHFIKNNNIKFL